MPSVDDLLAAQRAAVKDLEQKQRDLSCLTERREVLQDSVATAWRAAAGGAALAHARNDPAFHAVLTKVLDRRVPTGRKRKLLERWKTNSAEPAPEPETDATDDTEGDRQRTRKRRAEMRRELETLSADELLGQLATVETAEQESRERVARARSRKEDASSQLRSRERQWRVTVGLSVLTHAEADADFRSTLDEVFTRRIAEKDRALLARWRGERRVTPVPPNADDAPPDPDGVVLEGTPEKLPDGTWGALLDFPAEEIPSSLIGRQIKVKPRKGKPRLTTVIEVVKQESDGRVLVRRADNPPTGHTATPKTEDGGDARTPGTPETARSGT